MIENILILDTETTGLDPKKGAKVIEIAVVLYNLKFKSVLQAFSTLYPCDNNPAEHINHINPQSTKENYSLSCVDQFMMWISDCSQAVVAHNAKFDKLFVETLSFGRHILSKPWICTKQNFTWPIHLTRLRLEDICNAMGVQYLDAHRALSDCYFLVNCFNNVDDLEERINKCLE